MNPAPEKKFINIVPLGRDCGISFALTKLNLRAASSIFEWHLIDKFSELLYTFTRYLDGYPVEIETNEELPDNLFWKGTSIRTGHYTLENCHQTYKRRWDRLMLQIIGEPILFIRDDSFIQTTKEELVEFQTLLERINPQCKYKILLLSPSTEYSEIKMKNVFHRIINDDCLLSYIEEASYPYYTSMACSQKPNDDHD